MRPVGLKVPSAPCSHKFLANYVLLKQTWGNKPSPNVHSALAANHRQKFRHKRGGSGRKWKWKTASLLIINLAEFWSSEAGGKYIDVGKKMLIKERRTLWLGRHPSAQAVGNPAAAWANGASNAFGETRHQTQRRALMSLVDLSGTQDERVRCWEAPKGKKEPHLVGDVKYSFEIASQTRGEGT